MQSGTEPCFIEVTAMAFEKEWGSHIVEVDRINHATRYETNFCWECRVESFVCTIDAPRLIAAETD